MKLASTNGSCVSFHEHNSTFVEQRRTLREAIGAERVKMLESMCMMEELESRLLSDRSLFYSGEKPLGDSEFNVSLQKRKANVRERLII